MMRAKRVHHRLPTATATLTATADRPTAARTVRTALSMVLVSLGLIVVAKPACSQPFQPSRFFQNASNPLRSLPPMRALPITSGSTVNGASPSATTAPAYTDSESLRRTSTIRAIRFWDERQGVAVGDHGSILVTQDAGQTWSSRPVNTGCRFNDAIWVSARRIVVVGGGFDAITQISRGVVMVSNDAGKSWHPSSANELPYLHSVKNSDDADSRGNRNRGITAIGESDPITGATTFHSQNGGQSWQSSLPAPSERSDEAFRPHDLHPSVTATQSIKWSRLTGSKTVIRTSDQLSDDVLISGGDNGTILRSTDGGETWRRVHGDPASCAILVIAGTADAIPWALVGRESLEKRLRVNLLVGHPPALHTQLLEQAAMNLGVTALDTFPAVATDAFPDAGTNTCIESLKNWIDLHQPPVVAMDAAMPAEIKQSVLQHAVASGTAKVVEYSRGARAEMLMHDSAVLLACGALAGDFHDDSRLLVSGFEFTADSTTDPWIAITTRYGGGGKLAGGDSLGLGVRLTREHRLPGRADQASRRRSQIIRGRLKQQSTIDELFQDDSYTNRPHRQEEFASALSLLLDQTSRIDQFRSAWAIARKAIGTEFEVAVWNEIADRFPESSAARLAKLQSIARENSLEWRRHQTVMGSDGSFGQLNSEAQIAAQIGDVAPLPAASQELLPDRDGHAAIVSPFQSNPKDSPTSQLGVIQASASLPLGGEMANRSPTKPQASSKAAIDLAWQMHPVRLIVDDAVQRNKEHALIASLDQESDVEPTVTPQTQKHSADVRRIADRQTAWAYLLRPDSLQSTIAMRSETPPRLDGNLNEPFWNATNARSAETRSGVPLKLQFAWDDQFIYVAIQTPSDQFRLREVPQDVGTRDADLQGSDRVSIGFDIDQDLLTAMRLTMTRDGRTHDDLDGHPRWNPTWYLASREQDDTVVTEIAIEQSSLGVIVEPGDNWFVESESIPQDQARRYNMMPDPMTRIRVDFR